MGPANHSVTLKLEGRVVGPWVEELRQICELALGEGRPLRLDLADVSYADGDGITALTDIKSRGAELNNCSPFVELQLVGPQIEVPPAADP